MRSRWLSSLALALGVLTTTAQGADPGLPAASLGRPIATTHSGPLPVEGPTPATSGPAAALERPVPLSAPGLLDPQLQPATFSSSGPGSSGMVIRGANPEGNAVRPMPVGPAGVDPESGVALHGWSRAPENLGMPRTESEPILNVPNSSMPLPPPTAGAPLSGPMIPGPGAPFVSGEVGPDGCQCNASGPGEGGCCGPNCNDGCTFGNRWYAGAEYLLWWVKGDATPPLVTSGSNADLLPGAINPGSHTVTLFGDSGLGQGSRSGVRVFAGYWFNDEHCLGLEASYFTLGRQTDNFSQTSFGVPLLSRPFNEANTGLNTAQQVANPGRGDVNNPLATMFLPAIGGTVAVTHNSDFWGAELNLRRNLLCGPDGHVDLILGYRTLALDENLGIREDLIALQPNDPNVPFGTRFQVADSFAVRNRFYGGQLGAVGEYRMGNWILGGSFKLGLGDTQEQVDIRGARTLNGVPQAGGGLLAQPTNIGRYNRDMFTVVPELGLTVGYQFTDHMRGYIGYNYLYWSNVVRPGDQIDRTVDARQLANPPQSGGDITRPAFAFKGSDFWAQGLTFGLEFRY